MSILSPTPARLPRKRSPSVAFDAEPTLPPPSRPPSCAHAKRSRRRHEAERPAWVVARDAAVRVDARIDGAATRVDVRLPHGRGVQPQRPVTSLLRAGGFTVLCFLGAGGDATLRSVGAVAGLLANLGALCYGVSLADPDNRWGVPISKPPCCRAAVLSWRRCLELTKQAVHDAQRTMTTRLGLLHPLGGGRTALDAVVVLDGDSRARMVLPIGWGVRGCRGDADADLDDAGNRWENIVGRVVRGVEWLRCEQAEIGGREIEMLM